MAYLGQTYKLVDKVPVPCAMDECSKFSDRIIAKDYFDNVEVSTVFLTMDHSFGGKDPILFETMVFGGQYDDYQWRYSTYEEAESGHQAACYLVNKVSIDRDEKLKQLGI
jgi:hypothetical protein